MLRVAPEPAADEDSCHNGGLQEDTTPQEWLTTKYSLVLFGAGWVLVFSSPDVSRGQTVPPDHVESCGTQRNPMESHVTLWNPAQPRLQTNKPCPIIPQASQRCSKGFYRVAPRSTGFPPGCTSFHWVPQRGAASHGVPPGLEVRLTPSHVR